MNAGEIVTKHLVDAVGSQPAKASVTFLGLEPVDILRFVDGAPESGDTVVFASVGCSRHPMTDPTAMVTDTEAGPRAEVVVRMRASDPLTGLHRALATVAAAPAVEGLILVPDALIDLSEPMWTGSACTAILLEPDVIADCVLPPPAEPVRFLRAVPITANEAAWVRLKGAAALRELWAESSIDVTDPHRAAAPLR